ncbi:hypothetical protein V1505DRAFT_351827 [Lipomyces doorenjongii]
MYPVIIDGYGGLSRAWNKFDTVLSIVCDTGATGATYEVAVLRDVLWKGATVRTLLLCWIVRNYGDIIKFRDHLEQILKSRKMSASDLSVLIQVSVSDTSTISSNGQSEVDDVIAQHAEFIIIITGIQSCATLSEMFSIEPEAKPASQLCGTTTLTGNIKDDVAYFLERRCAGMLGSFGIA